MLTNQPTPLPAGAVISYRLDLNDWQTSNVLTNVPYGKHTVSIRMVNGTQTCYATRDLAENLFDGCGKLSCDFRIVAKDDLGVETSTLARDPATKGLKTLKLSVESFDGSNLTNGVTYDWTLFQKGTAIKKFSSAQAQVTIGAIGTYIVKLTRSGATCTAEIAINSKPCLDTPEPTTKCETKALTGVTDEIANRLTELAIGDVVRCGDFNVTIIEVSGSPAGWNGKGYVTVPYVNATVSIILQNAVFNDCYQLTNANATATQPTVYTEYDPKWSNIADVDNILTNFKKSLQEVIDIMNNFSGKCEDVRALDKAVKEYEQGFSQANSTYTEAERISMLAKITDLKAKRDQLVSCSSCSVSSGRIAAATDATPDCGAKAILCRDALKDMLGNAKEKNEDCGDTKRLNAFFAITKNPGKIALKYPNFYNGALIALIINSYYLDKSNKAHKVTFEYAIPESSVNRNQGYADILNLTTGEIFEIKSKPNALSGKQQLDRYINKATSKCGVPPTWKAGNSVFPVGESNAIRQNVVLDGKKKVLYFWMSNDYNGVVLYRLDDVDDEEPWYDVFNFPEAINALKLLAAASISKMKQATKISDIPALKEQLLKDIRYSMQKIPSSVINAMIVLTAGSAIFAILSNAIPGNQIMATLTTVFVGVVGFVAYEELKHRPES